MRSIVIDGQISYNAVSQIFNSETFRALLTELIKDSVRKKTSLYELFDLFIKDPKESVFEERYDIDSIIQLLLALMVNTIEEIDTSKCYSFPRLSDKKELLVKFVESLFSLWRNKHRFMLRRDTYTPARLKRIFKQTVLVNTNAELKTLVLNTYRQILINISDVSLKIMRQEPGGAQVSFLVDKPEIHQSAIVEKAKWLYDLDFVWSIIFEPPVIFYTRSNKRRGLFKVIDRPILHKLSIDNPQNWLLFPIFVGNKLLFVLTNKEYLALAAGLGNLFEIASFHSIRNRKPDGIYVFGINSDFFEKPEDVNGVIYKEEDNMYVGLIGDHPSIDYFGYMKKMILTIHNLLVLDEGRLPIHGALAQIRLKDGKCANIMLIGDSGAGKSETLDALNQLKEEVSEVNILIDDMGSLAITETGEVVAFGTETGAFVRLDDLQPGYAYSTMDRSIFMNPNVVNARVIVPYSNYDEIIRPTKIDYFLYANNYQKVKEGEEIRFFNSVEEALEVFSKGARIAKGTTSEKGLTHSYFANPFGAIQRKERHNEIAIKFLKAMMNTGVKIGEVCTQLGISSYEQIGPLQAAKSLIKLIQT
ncbi:hypothetical protein [Kosmotoga pacifica]|uniref:ATPase n=1 Tax=Kosmotoga pacifica TaxID=1330330 RepID=A0A0G2Z708_9BACT|nr:hypothetical protein [Kosmotoga pacifica]AKI97385.1 ATPase [Kosmotoga pacifica]